MRPGIRVLLASLLLVPLWYLAFHRACRSTGQRYGPGGQVASVRSTPANAAKESQPSETTAARVATPETTTQFDGFAPAPPVSATSSQAPRLAQIAPAIAPPTVALTVDEQNSPPRRPAPRKSAAEVIIASTTKNQLTDLHDLKKSADSLPAVGLIIGGLLRGNKGAMLHAATGWITTNGQRPRTLEPDRSTPYIAGGGAKGTILAQLVGPGPAKSPPPEVTRMSGGTADIAGS